MSAALVTEVLFSGLAPLFVLVLLGASICPDLIAWLKASIESVSSVVVLAAAAYFAGSIVTPLARVVTPELLNAWHLGWTVSIVRSGHPEPVTQLRHRENMVVVRQRANDNLCRYLEFGGALLIVLKVTALTTLPLGPALACSLYRFGLASGCQSLVAVATVWVVGFLLTKLYSAYGGFMVQAFADARRVLDGNAE